MKFKRLPLGISASLLVISIAVPGPRVHGSEARPLHTVNQSSKHDLSPALRSIPPRIPVMKDGSEDKTFVRERPLLRRKFPERKMPAPDLRIRDEFGAAQMPAPIVNIQGVSSKDNRAVNGYTSYPPDPNGDVGPNHYVQWVNISFAIWDKKGERLYGPAGGNTLWSGFGGPCEETNDGDPIVLYDRMADRWVMSQFALPNADSNQGPFYQCVAISQTGDPTDSWYRYEFKISDSKMNDYPKLGVWPDAYYMSVNQFQYDSESKDWEWAGAGVVAFERNRMLEGLEADWIYFDLYGVDPNLGNMLPSHLNGPNPPPAGSPNYFVQFDDDAWGVSGEDQLRIWGFFVDWQDPANSSFAPISTLPTEPFDSNMCNYIVNCIPQPKTAKKLDALSDRLMYRLQYRNFGNGETMVVNHTVDANGSNRAGIRWYELQNLGSGWFIRQQGTYAPDSNHRWMGSIAMDGSGNIALGYSISGTSTYPSIRYAGRLAEDPLHLLTQGETTLVSGKGQQKNSSRWGDYSTMSIDPSDDCTFWYTQEYYEKNAMSGWKTRIGSFRFPSCQVSSGPVDSNLNLPE